MRSTRSYLIVLLVFIGLLCVAFLEGYTTPAHLGLDLQGGLEVVLKAEPQQGQKVTQQDLEQSISIIRERVDKLGVSEPQIRTEGANQIAVDLPGIKDPDAAVKVIGSTAQLHFYDLQKVLVGGKVFRDPWVLLKRYKDIAGKTKKKPDTFYLFNSKHILVDGPASTTTDLLATHHGKLPKGDIIKAVPPGYIMVHGDPQDFPDNLDETGHFDKSVGVYGLFKNEPALSGSEIKQAAADTENGGWVTTIVFTSKGADDFHKVTQQLAQDGQLDHQFHQFSIVLDDEVKSSPIIDYTKYPDGLSGGQAEIDGLKDQQEASDLALVLNTGALPVRFVIVEKVQKDATLGHQALREGLIAGGVGLAIVMIYLIVFYRFLGLIADLALASYAFLFYALIVGIPIVMTLPGIAGMILTVGVAADANIVIFERVREEFRAGRPVRTAIETGYRKGLRTIVDANVVTLITAIILIVFGQGEVRGFALLLGAGVVLSMFTAVAATFALLGILGHMKIFDHAWVIGGSRKPLRFRVKWLKARKAMYVWTLIVVLASVGLLAFKGLNLGIDFKGGTQITATLKKSASEDQIRATLGKVEPSYADAVVQKLSAPAGSKQLSGFQYDIELGKIKGGTKASNTEDDRVRNALDSKFGVQALSTSTIGPTFGHQIVSSALLALLLCFGLEVIYIALRFERKYALPVFAALFHDLLAACGAYALVGREFNSETVAALLTILGYSLYDTIIVFDRVRENTHLLRKSRFARIVDASLNEVLTRSLNTTFVTLLPIAAIYIFGGQTLQDFAFALLIGVFAGAYSSIVVASPLLNWFKEREPAWRARIDAEGEGSEATIIASGTSVAGGTASQGAGGRRRWTSTSTKTGDDTGTSERSVITDSSVAVSSDTPQRGDDQSSTQRPRPKGKKQSRAQRKGKR